MAEDSDKISTAKMHMRDLVVRDGDVMAILRPDDPVKALALVDEIKRAESAGEITSEDARERFDGVITTQPYVFAGLPTVKGDLVHPETGEKIGRVQAGDSFLSFDDVKAIVAIQPEPH